VPWRGFLIVVKNTEAFMNKYGFGFDRCEVQLEECDFDRQFLFDEYVAISDRHDLKRISLKS
jgi:hypothetical protein